MKELYKRYLFNHGILVSKNERHDLIFEVLFTLANKFGIEVVEGRELAEPMMIVDAEACLGEHVPEPFYKGFPDTVRALSDDQIIFDQLFHYFKTYGLGEFYESGLSIFESKDYKKIAFKEAVTPKQFKILTKKAAIEELEGYFYSLLSATRPLSAEQFSFVNAAADDYGFEILNVASKNTAIKLVRERRDVKLAGRLLKLTDMIDLVDEINYEEYDNKNVKKLNLKNQDRKFISAVLDELFYNGLFDEKPWSAVFEKQAKWVGLLHHIHYKPKIDEAKKLIEDLRSGVNHSDYSMFEWFITQGDIIGAIRRLYESKGATAVLRHFNYILSRCKTMDEVMFLLKSIKLANPIAIMQLLLYYVGGIDPEERRTFVFNKHGLIKVHRESDDEMTNRKPVSPMVGTFIKVGLKKVLKEHYSNRPKKYKNVYISETMKNVALPIEESSSSGGYGVLPKGSRVRMDISGDKVVRLFTYWEKVNDIDLSMIGLDRDGKLVHEFSWRTFGRVGNHMNDADICFSGDETSGYNGGSEYFDVNVKLVKEKYPEIRYLVCCDNVYSQSTFKNCICRAGYMVRDTMTSGEIYEPKTVKTAFTINADSTFAYLFAFDLMKSELIWLNLAVDGRTHVAGTANHSFLKRYFKVADTLNYYDFFTLFAENVTEDLLEADLVVSDAYLIDYKEGAKQIKSYDFEKVLEFMNS